MEQQVMNSATDQIVTAASREFVDQLGGLNADPYIREAVMKLAIREVSWAMLEISDEQHSLADQLELMSELVREHKEENER
jgi:hypothetical protein